MAKEYDQCPNCGSNVILAYNHVKEKHFMHCTGGCHYGGGPGFDTRAEAQEAWNQHWDSEWRGYSKKTIFKI